MITNKIVVIGSANTDMVVNSTKLPLPGETLMGGTFFKMQAVKAATKLLLQQGLAAELL